jgi:hypothetical protein
VQTSTNCYAYAMNSRLGHPAGGKPQPGDAASHKLWDLGCPSLTAAVLADAKGGQVTQAHRCPYQRQHRLPPPDKPDHYLVALVTTSNDATEYDHVAKTVRRADYHWYRQNPDGTWSHKPGHGAAVATDSDGHAITNPETAARISKLDPFVTATGETYQQVIDYNEFCGYFYVKSSGSWVGPQPPLPPVPAPATPPPAKLPGK